LAYRDNTYGWDWMGAPMYNMFRHRREGGTPQQADALYVAPQPVLSAGSADTGMFSSYNLFELRRSRTPVPGHVAEAVYEHRDRIYAREIKRAGPAYLQKWW